jgi:DNA-binding CsgD family transcriptional regulator
MDDSTVLTLLGQLYPSDSPQVQWDDFARGLSKELAGAFCAIWGTRAPARPLGISHPHFRRALLRYYESGDHRYGPLLETDYPIGRGTPSPVWLDGGAWMRGVLGIDDPAVEGILLPLVGDGCQVRSTLVAFPLEASSLPVGAAALLERLAPLLCHSVQAARQERIDSSRIELHRWLTNHLRFGLLFLDADGRILFANRAGASILAGHEASDFVADAASACRGEELEYALARLREEQRQADPEPARHCVTLFPLSTPGSNDRIRPERTAVVITPGNGPAGVSEDWMRDRYQLTPAEARLAALLAADCSLEEAAAELGVAVGTVRTRLKSIFSKTDTHRQASLVRLLLSDPPPPFDL